MAVEPGPYVYQADTGLGAHHAGWTGPPDGMTDRQREMTELDLQPGTAVTVIGHDEDRDLILVSWIDATGTPRTTSVEPTLFADHFVEG